MTRRAKLNIKTKRVYDAPARADGCRILVDRIWPRGLSKADAALDVWIKDVSPSTALRQWFGHDPAKWANFTKKYFSELAKKQDAIELVLAASTGPTVTLLYGAKDVAHNNAVALKKYLDERAPARRPQR
ncbi:MAG: DUF488 domain-containing protein [Polyangiaceae bacterium]